MVSASSHTASLHSLPEGTYHSSGGACGIHTYFGPGGAEVTFKRKYRIGKAYTGDHLPMSVGVDTLRQLLEAEGESIQIAPMGRAR